MKVTTLKGNFFGLNKTKKVIQNRKANKDNLIYE